MNPLPSEKASTQMANALHQMKTALDMLDQAETPLEVGAMLDLAINRLEELLDRAAPTNVQAMIAQIEWKLAPIPSSPCDVPSS